MHQLPTNADGKVDLHRNQHMSRYLGVAGLILMGTKGNIADVAVTEPAKRPLPKAGLYLLTCYGHLSSTNTPLSLWEELLSRLFERSLASDCFGQLDAL